MKQCKYVVYGALWASAAACAAERGDDDLAPAGSEAEWHKTPKSPHDASVDGAPPSTDAPMPTTDGGSGGDGGGGGGSGSSGGFIDACNLPGMTRAVFNPTGSFDAHDEGVTSTLTLPFPFTLYGTSHTKFWITTNGQLGFGSMPGGSTFGQVTCPLPDARFGTPILLVYSVDLIGRLEGDAGVCFATTGTAPDRKLVVTWKDSFFYEAWLTSDVTFSAALHEGTNVVDVALARVDAPSLPTYESGAAAVLGAQAGGSAHAFSCFQPLAPEGTVVHYTL